jgi:hypothetical protein
MIFLVYSCIAPLVSFVIGLCFAVLGALFRHQFVYNYGKKPDSGGLLWLNFTRVLTSCLLVAEVTVTGLLALKKAKLATPLMFPLIIVTALFSVYIRQEHYRIATALSSRLCLKKDSRNEKNGFDLTFLREGYLQPELREKVAFPENMNDRIVELGICAEDGVGNDSVEQLDDDNDEDDESCSRGPPSVVATKNPWLVDPREAVLPSGVSCRVSKLGSIGGTDPLDVDISMLSEDSVA